LAYPRYVLRSVRGERDGAEQGKRFLPRVEARVLRDDGYVRDYDTGEVGFDRDRLRISKVIEAKVLGPTGRDGE
jgi:hypothetical protein